jgi:hypothetical protein
MRDFAIALAARIPVDADVFLIRGFREPEGP